MTIAESSERRSRSTVFELIASFSESADARLRGNAVQALAALVDSQDKSLREQAIDEIVRVMSAEPGGSGALDWQRRFVARCLDALARLQPTERQLLGERILATTPSAREPERRAAVARLGLAAMEHDRRFWAAGWIRWLRLARFASRSGFWITVWAALWRTAIVWGILALAAASAPWFMHDETFSTDLYSQASGIAVLTAIILVISTQLSISGSIRPPLGIIIPDITVSAATFALLIILPAWTDDAPDLSGRDVLHLSILGFVLGAGLRALRWVAVAAAIEPNAAAVVFRPLAAVGITTLVCIVAGRVGMNMRTIATGWMVLAPATVIAAWLDIWLENTEPHPLSQGPAPTDIRWAIPVLAVSAILLSGWLAHMNIQQALAMDNKLQLAALHDGAQPAHVIEEVQLLGNSGPTEPITVTAGFGHRIPVKVDNEGKYQIVAKANPSERIKLFFGSSDRLVIDNSSGDQLRPPTIIKKMKKDGNYFVCVMPEGQQSCSLSAVANLRDLDLLVINGNIWRDVDTQTVHAISISRAP